MTPGATGGQQYFPLPSQQTHGEATPALREPTRHTYLPPQHQDFHPQQQQPQEFFAQQQLLPYQQAFLQDQSFPQQQSHYQDFPPNFTQNLPAPMAHDAYQQHQQALIVQATMAARFAELKTLRKSQICLVPLQDLQRIQAHLNAHYSGGPRTRSHSGQNLANLVADMNNHFEMWYGWLAEYQEIRNFRNGLARFNLEAAEGTAKSNNDKVENWLDHMVRVSNLFYLNEWHEGQDEVVTSYWREGVPIIDKGYVNFVEMARKQGYRIPLTVAPRHTQRAEPRTKKRSSDDDFDFEDIPQPKKRSNLPIRARKAPAQRQPQS